MNHFDIAIIGGGAAGFYAAKAARQSSPEKSILLIDTEDRLPYKRTKVSKSFAKGFAKEAFALEGIEWDNDPRITLMNRQKDAEREVTAIDVREETLTIDGKTKISWGSLILATGAEPQADELTSEVFKKLHFTTSKETVERLRSEAGEAKNVLVVGTGVLGVEVVNELRSLKSNVTFLSNRSAIMRRNLNPAASQIMKTLLEDNGVTLRLNDKVTGIALRDGKMHVTFQSSVETREFDAVVYAIGLKPRIELAAKAGLPTSTGVLVDDKLRVLGHENIYAAGDVAEHFDRPPTNLWRHAKEQGEVAGRNAAGADSRYTFVPFRLKVELFKRYFFSLCQFEMHKIDDYTPVEYKSPSGVGTVWAYYDSDSLLQGIVMVDDKDRETLYRQLCAHRWHKTKVEAALKPFAS